WCRRLRPPARGCAPCPTPRRRARSPSAAASRRPALAPATAAGSPQTAGGLPDISRSASWPRRYYRPRRRIPWVEDAALRGGGRTLAIDLPEHDIERAQHGRDVGEHVPLAEKIHRLQMREAR